jgi:predicted RNA-binding Zn ribbon-like protein
VSAKIEQQCAELGPTVAPAGAVLAAALFAKWSSWDGTRHAQRQHATAYSQSAIKMSAVIVKLLQKSAAGQQQQQQHLCITLQHVRAAVKGVYSEGSGTNKLVVGVVAALEQLLRECTQMALLPTSS